MRYLYDGENVRITCESVISKLVQYLVLRIPLLRGFILGREKKRKLAKQGRVHTVPPGKTGERREGRYTHGVEKESSRTMHQCEGTWFIGKSSPN